MRVSDPANQGGEHAVAQTCAGGSIPPRSEDAQMTVPQRPAQPADVPVVSPRLVVSRELLERLLYLWLRDARLDPDDKFARSHIEDHIELVLGPGIFVYGDSKLLAFVRSAIDRCAQPGVVLKEKHK